MAGVSGSGAAAVRQDWLEQAIAYTVHPTQSEVKGGKLLYAAKLEFLAQDEQFCVSLS